jgi:hypothetical protein
MTMGLLLVRYALAGVLLALGLWLAVLNWRVFWHGHVRGEKTASWIPLLAGLLGSLGLLALPVVNARWWWIPFCLDWGSAPGLLYSAAWHLRRMATKDAR